MIETISMVGGGIRYEFRMQARRRAVWVVLGALSLIILTSPVAPWVLDPARTPLSQAIGSWALLIMLILPIGFGALLADRLPRDRRTGVDGLLATLPVPAGVRLIGKYLGAALGTFLPIAVIYVAGLVIAALRWGDLPSTVGWGLAALATIMAPGLLFVAAFSIACTALLWAPLYQFLFIGYWFWGNLLSPVYGIPTLSASILAPLGGVSADALFGVDWPMAADATPLHALASIALLLALAAAILAATWRYLEWQRARA